MGEGSILSATSLRNLFQVPRTSGGQECCTSEPYTVLAKPSDSRMIVVTSGGVLLCSNFSTVSHPLRSPLCGHRAAMGVPE
jgi:hypothetical protein